MKPDYRESRKRRVILLYAAGVVIPGLILGYMAFRGIMNDQAIREKESRQRLESVREHFFSALDSLLFEDFRQSTGDSTPSPYSDESIKAILLITQTGSAKLVDHHLLYLPSEFLNQPQRASGFSNPELEEAQKLEYGAESIAEALVRYETIARGTPDSASKLRALTGKARILRKTGRAEESANAYQSIADDFAGFYIVNHLPARHTAWLELAKMAAADGGSAYLESYCRMILTSLLNPDLDYGISHFNYMYRTVKELISDDTRIDSLTIQLDHQARQTEWINSRLINPELIFSNRNMHIIPMETGLFLRPLYQDNLMALTAENREPEHAGQWLVIFDLENRFRSLAGDLMSKADPDHQLKWQIEDPDGNPVYQSDRSDSDYIRYPFPDGYPKWSLGLYEDQPGLLANLLAPQRGVFMLIFVFILAMMLFGLFFTLHTLNQEIRLNALKSEFIANVSHELKSPLTSIRLRAELLKENRVPIKQQPEYHSNILDQSEQLSHLIENILDFSRIEDDRKKYQFEEISLIPYLRKIVDSFSQRQIGTKIRIDLIGEDDIPRVRIDREAMQQVVYNLLDNACKFSGGEERVEIGLRVLGAQRHGGTRAQGHGGTRDQGEEVLIWVRDWGMGISGKDQERIFERFYRAEEGRKRGIKGSGIGLTLVKRIVEAHGGRITVESEPGKGTTFKIYLPVSQ